MSTVKGIALITGSAQGIGRAIALRLARDGFDIALNDVPSKHEQLRAVADDIEKIGRRTYLYSADVSVEEEVKGMINDVVEKLGGLDVMVANAGISCLSTLVDLELDLWERILAINARGPFLCYKYAAQQMIKQGRGGRIIGASSILGKTGIQGSSAYSASKFAVRALTQCAALELGPYNITVNSYAPGAVNTPMLTAALDELSKSGRNTADILDPIKEAASRKPIKGDLQPEDIASIVSYLASKEAHFITGQCISVDGGGNLS